MLPENIEQVQYKRIIKNYYTFTDLSLNHYLLSLSISFQQAERNLKSQSY